MKYLAVSLTLSLSVLCGCASQSYQVMLQPEPDMNQNRSAVRVDLIWTTAEDQEELRSLSAAEWFLGKQPLCRQKRFLARTLTTEVPLSEIGSDPLDLHEGPLIPPTGLEATGFVVFALYEGADSLPPDALRDFHDPEKEGATQFTVYLEKKRISMKSQDTGKFLGVF